MASGRKQIAFDLDTKAEEDKVMDIVKDVVYSKAMFFVSDEIENEIER